MCLPPLLPDLCPSLGPAPPQAGPSPPHGPLLHWLALFPSGSLHLPSPRLPGPSPDQPASAAVPHSRPLTPVGPLLLWLGSFLGGAPLLLHVTPQPPDCPLLVPPSPSPALAGSHHPLAHRPWLPSLGRAQPHGDLLPRLPTPCTLQPGCSLSLGQCPVAPPGLQVHVQRASHRAHLIPQPPCLLGSPLPKPGLFPSQLCHPPARAACSNCKKHLELPTPEQQELGPG